MSKPNLRGRTPAAKQIDLKEAMHWLEEFIKRNSCPENLQIHLQMFQARFHNEIDNMACTTLIQQSRDKIG
jgi:hypothetical protein